MLIVCCLGVCVESLGLVYISAGVATSESFSQIGVLMTYRLDAGCCVITGRKHHLHKLKSRKDQHRSAADPGNPLAKIRALRLCHLCLLPFKQFTHRLHMECCPGQCSRGPPDSGRNELDMLIVTWWQFD